MKKGFRRKFPAAVVACLTASFFLPLTVQGQTAVQDADKKVNTDSVSYFLGLSIGMQMASQGFSEENIEIPSIARGITHSLKGKKSELSDADMEVASKKIQEIFASHRRVLAEKRQAAGVANLEKSKLFLEENAKKEGVKTLAKGLQYRVLKAGDGQSPTENSRVKVHYTGKLIDGTVFDSSVARKQPAKFPVGGVIKGWKMALQSMKVGAKWMLYISPELAYGENGPQRRQGQRPSLIGPNDALIFEVELLEILN